MAELPQEFIKRIYKDGYNKAIDDCLKIITVCCWKNAEMIEELVEKLKEGVSDETDG